MKNQIYVITLLRHIDENAVDTLYLHTYDTLEEYTKVSDKLIKTFENIKKRTVIDYISAEQKSI